ncbi:MAG: phenylalanine--tRNA ligase subunit alpha, partial [Firmicutes bacterium]|nr:phenylalanine--tRNA ligase subunit alpha [Bacillota bacterium]
MKAELEKILNEAKEQIKAATTPEATEDIRVNLLGKNGKLTTILRSMGSLSKEEKKELGAAANAAKREVEELLNKKVAEVKAAAQNAKLIMEKVDVTEPGTPVEFGAEHPLTVTTNELVKVFNQMGFTVVEGPEVETVWYNFDALNSPINH